MSEDNILIDFKDFINENEINVQEVNSFEEKLLSELIMNDSNDKSFNINSLYQFQPISNTNSVNLKVVGNGNNRPSIFIYQTKFNGYLCKLVSYVLTEKDIKLAEKSCCIPILSLLFIRKNSTRFVLNLEFHTFDHIKTKSSLLDYVSENYQENKILCGFFGVYLKVQKHGKIIKTEIDIIKKICNITNLTYLLFKYISDERVKKMLCNK